MSENDTKQPTNQDILTAMNQFATDITADVYDLKQDMRAVKQDVGGLKQDVKTLQNDVATIKGTMVTKVYLDEKMSDLRGDMTMLVRKEDNKFTTLVDTLYDKQVLNAGDVGRILALEPFPKTGQS
ncbi:MAG: hypothetical protein ACD_41C00348G0005 [uncultured bacterium]|nr:MAG: hypothetical protein ACD_41C00348G0005 [uncultured bacterium]HBY74306.1 hypothetical protein [Candidatus Kerfeldbacteria bacterium]